MLDLYGNLPSGPFHISIVNLTCSAAFPLPLVWMQWLNSTMGRELKEDLEAMRVKVSQDVQLAEQLPLADSLRGLAEQKASAHGWLGHTPEETC